MTLPQFHALGIHPTVFLDECILTEEKTELGNKWIGEKAIRWALAQAPDKPILFLEDDIDLAPDFPDALRLAITAGVTTYFYINEANPFNEKTFTRMERLYGARLAERMVRREPTRMRLVEARSYVGLFGTQCVLIPPNIASRVAEEHIPRARKAFDAALQACLAEKHRPAFIAVPNVVQHRHDRTAREPERFMKRSVSFDCPRKAEGDVAAA